MGYDRSGIYVRVDKTGKLNMLMLDGQISLARLAMCLELAIAACHRLGRDQCKFS